MSTSMKLRLVMVALALAWFLSASEAKAQSISVTSGHYSSRTDYEVDWKGSYSLPPGVTNYTIEAYIRPSTGSWTQGTASWFNLQWSGYGTTDPAAAVSYVAGRLWYMEGSYWYYVDFNILPVVSPYN